MSLNTKVSLDTKMSLGRSKTSSNQALEEVKFLTIFLT